MSQSGTDCLSPCLTGLRIFFFLSKRGSLFQFREIWYVKQIKVELKGLEWGCQSFTHKSGQFKCLPEAGGKLRHSSA